jgi:GDP-L-fucose synthase
VYGQNKNMKEENVWKTFPSEHDKYAGWAKRMGELQVEAYKKEFDFESLHIIRPANIYGPYLNFNPQNSMVVGSLIRRILSGENPLKVWGDGSNIRDFIYSEDVANAMLDVMEKNIQLPINIGSGKGISIKKLINTLLKCKNINRNPKIVFQKTKESGDKIRVLDVNYAKRFGIIAKISLKEGLEKTIEWYKKNKLDNRFNYFLNN